MEPRLIEKCDEVLADVDRFERELLDCLRGLHDYRARLLAIRSEYAPTEAPEALFEEVRGFLADEG